MTAADRVRITIRDGVADVRLNRPERHNALDLETFEALRATQGRLRDEPSVRAVVLRGEGPSFCSGLDLAAFATGTFDPSPLIDRPEDEDANLAQSAALGWRTLPVPVIAAVHGACFGGGLQIALGADVRIAAPDARLSVMEVQLGLAPDMAISRTLPGIVREDVASELCLTGRVVDGSEAAALGLVTRTAADPAAEANGLAASIAARSPQAIRAIKRLVAAGWGASSVDSLRLETRLVRGLLGTPNQLEAVGAAIEGRAPTFTDPAGTEP